MLTPPDLADAHIAACLHDSYEKTVARATFLPIGADLNTAVYRVDTTDGTPYFLKLRRGDFDQIAVAVPAFLHHNQGITAIMAPLPAANGQLSVRSEGFDWMLFPFIEGANGFDQALEDNQWITFGAAMSALHTATLPAEWLQRIPQERYDPHWRTLVTMLDAQVDQPTFDDPIARECATLWQRKRREIRTLVARAEQLAHVLRQRELPFVVCHGDIHSWNVLCDTDGGFHIVDWDTLIRAPKERDLMFIGSGIGAIWNTAREEALFYQGYGAPCIDRAALSYYRYERIVTDIAVTGEQIFGVQGSADDRAEGLHQISSQFLPNSEIEHAHITYSQFLSE